MSQPKYRRPLNPKQLDILIILYKFRFANVDLFCRFLDLDNQSGMYKRLKILEDQNYIGRIFTNQDMIDRRPALYYLRTAGVNYLKTIDGVSHKAIANTVRDNNRKRSFIDRCLMILELHNKLRQLYGNKLQFYAKPEISDYDFFPKNLPDGYMLINEKPYMLEWFASNTPYQQIRGKISQLLTHYDSGEWDSSGEDYPTILFICADVYVERLVKRIASRAFYKAEDQGIDPEGLTILTTTLKAFNTAQDAQQTIWSDNREPEGLVRL